MKMLNILFLLISSNLFAQTDFFISYENGLNQIYFFEQNRFIFLGSNELSMNYINGFYKKDLDKITLSYKNDLYPFIIRFLDAPISDSLTLIFTEDNYTNLLNQKTYKTPEYNIIYQGTKYHLKTYKTKNACIFKIPVSKNLQSSLILNEQVRFNLAKNQNQIFIESNLYYRLNVLNNNKLTEFTVVNDSLIIDNHKITYNRLRDKKWEHTTYDSFRSNTREFQYGYRDFGEKNLIREIHLLGDFKKLPYSKEVDIYQEYEIENEEFAEIEDIAVSSEINREVAPTEEIIPSKSKILASFKGGTCALQSYINSRTHQLKKKKNIKSKEFYRVAFGINRTGKITYVEILEGSNAKYNNDIKAIFETMPDWDNAYLNGFPVKARAVYSLSIDP
ncbi:MAG: hypothetical protein MUE53_07690 [Chitinophagales bacterium]|jgi:hypothetical protein|nr:hypothetical protein [Chitinophagales bacterium]